MKLTIEIDGDILAKALQEDYKSVHNDIATLKMVSSRRDLLAYEKEDLEDYKELRKALRKLLKYYMVRPEADQFIREVEK